MHPPAQPTLVECFPLGSAVATPVHCHYVQIQLLVAFALLCELCDIDTSSLVRVSIKMLWRCCLSCERVVVVGLLAGLSRRQSLMYDSAVTPSLFQISIH